LVCHRKRIKKVGVRAASGGGVLYWSAAISDWSFGKLHAGKPLASVHTLSLSGQGWSYVGAAQKVREELQSWCKFVKLVVKQAKCGSEKRVSAKRGGTFTYYAPNKSLKLTLQARFLRSARPQAARCWSGRNLAQSLGASGFVSSKVVTPANQFKVFFRSGRWRFKVSGRKSGRCF